MATVLIVDDEQPIVELVRFTLEDEQVRVVEAGDGFEALEAAREHRPDLARSVTRADLVRSSPTTLRSPHTV